MQDKKKILVVLQSALHVRNFVTSGLISKIADKADILLVLSKKLNFALPDTVLKKVQVKNIENYLPGKARKKQLTRFRAASIFHRRTLNSTYKAKVAERLLFFNSKSVFMFKSLIRRFPMHLLFYLLSFVVDLEKIAKGVDRRVRANPNALRLIDEFKPDIVFSSTVIHETGDIEIARAAKLRGIPLVNFVASWDNLTSKGFFLVRPDTLLVWGEVDKANALKEHGFNEDQIIVTGAPHFDMYFDKTVRVDRTDFLKARKLDPAKKIILFAGTTFSIIANESELVKKLSEYLIEHNFKNVIIWYRPHPRAVRIDDIEKINGISNIYIDDHILKMHNDPKQGKGFSVSPNALKHSYNMINCCECVISVLSTMAVEFALYGKPAVWINFHITSNMEDKKGVGRCVVSSDHLQPVFKWKGISFVDSFSALANCVIKILKHSCNYDPGELQKSANNIAFNCDGKAQERIINALLEK